MTTLSTTIRVSVEQRDRLRKLAAQCDRSMADTFDAALESLRREQFYKDMADSQSLLRADPEAWSAYAAERDAWANADLS